MKWFFVIAVAIALTACVGNNSWSQTGGAGTPGGAGGAGTAGAAGTAGTAGAAGTSGRAGAAGTAGAAGQIGPIGGVGANAQVSGNFGGISPTPFFADPAVRRQIGMSNVQFNRLNRAYQESLQQFNRNLANLNTAGGTTSAATGSTNRATPDALRRQQLRTGTDTTVTGTDRAAAQRAQNLSEFQSRRNATRTVGTDTAAEQRARQLQEFQDRFATEFNRTVDRTFTDPTMRTRFNQLNWQFQGVGAFTDPQVQQQLNLTPQQRQQLAALAAEWRQQLDNRQTTLTAERFNALRTQFNNRLNTILTPEQVQLWAQLIGPIHNFPVSAFVRPSPTATTNQADAGTVQQGGTTTQQVVPQGGTTRRSQNPAGNSGTLR